MTRKSEKGGSSRVRRSDRVRAHLERVHLFAAGIDVGSGSHFVAVPADLCDEPVREFGSFTGELHRLADWLVSLGIETVAMESTGIYWIPLYEILEARGLEVVLVDARHVKNVPGRKSDVMDCQWLQELHSFGLLRGAFRPSEEIVGLRAYLRQRDLLIAAASDSIRHMQKALRQMNLLLDKVVSDVTGTTGLAIIRAILDGERDPHRLATLRDRRCRADEASIAAALEGHYRHEHLFELGQAVERYDFYQKQIASCETELKRHLDQLGPPDGDEPPAPPPRRKPKGHSKNGLEFEARDRLYSLTGVDLTEIVGMSEGTVLTILSETGLDLSPWPSEKHFASWLALSPGNKVSGGKRLSSKTKPSANRAAAAFRMAAYSSVNSKSAIGAYYRRQRARLGAPKAITATAHKLARIFYCMLVTKTAFVDLGPDHYEQQYRQRLTRTLKRKAADLGYQLVPKAPESPQNAMP